MADRSLPSAPSSPNKSHTAKKKKERSASEKAAMRKEKATQELVDTEVTYNTLLGLLISHYVLPLGDYKLVTNEQHNTLFPQLQIIKGLSDKFLEDLRTRRENWDALRSKLSDLFETFTPYFRMYQGYVNNHEKSVALMRKLGEKEKWTEYVATVRPLCERFDLASLLILPIQRLPRYRLLLSEIVKNTQASHPDHGDLSLALQKVENISLEINSRMKEFERRETVKKIERKFDGAIRILEPHRQFVSEGKLWKVCRNKDRLYHFFLFNDILIYASSYGRGYKFHNQLPINAAFKCLVLEDASAYGSEKNGRIFSIVSEKKSFVVYADTRSEAQRWVDNIRQCVEEQSKKTHSGHYKTDSHSAGVWMPDSHSKSCNICGDKFTFVNRRHHCRRCGALVCSKCSKYKLPNAESVMQRACRKCYFAVNISDVNESEAKASANNESDDEDDFEDENAALHQIPYYVDNTDETYQTEDIFKSFGHGVGSYVLVPADQNSQYYTVTLVVYTQTGFESFNVELFEKKGAMLFRLESNKLKKKDFNDMNGLIAYIEKKQKLIFSYAIPRAEVHQSTQKSIYDTQLILSYDADDTQQPINTTLYSPKSIHKNGLDNYPKARALFDYEAEVHGDLTLRAGDIIYILDRQEEEGWWTGMINQRQGLFPSTYVEIIDEKPLPQIHKNEPNEGDTLIARYDYNQGGVEELAFNIGDQIILQAKDESGWWLGKLCKTGVVGWFAPDLVVPLNDDDDEEETTTTATTTKPKKSPKQGKKKKKTNTKSNNKTSTNHSNQNGGSTGSEPDIVISYKDMKIKKFGAHENAIDKTKLELYLSNKEFYQIFKMTRSEFAAKPGWKQRNIRKDKGLF
eukprot:152115_1